MLNVTLPVRELRALQPKAGVWHPLAYSRLVSGMNAQASGLRSACVQSVADYFTYAYIATEFLKWYPRAERIRTLKANIAGETTAIENSTSGTPDIEERRFMMRAVRALRARAEQLPNAPS